MVCASPRLIERMRSCLLRPAEKCFIWNAPKNGSLKGILYRYIVCVHIKAKKVKIIQSPTTHSILLHPFSKTSVTKNLIVLDRYIVLAAINHPILLQFGATLVSQMTKWRMSQRSVMRITISWRHPRHPNHPSHPNRSIQVYYNGNWQNINR